MHRTCPLLGLLGRRRVRAEKARERPVVGGPPRGCTALARFLAFLAAGEYGPRRRENGPLSAGPPGVHRTCPLLGLLGRRRVRAEKARERPVVGGAPRGAPHLPASWPSWPPASTGREGARTARCRRGPQGCTALARFLAFLAAGEYGPRRRENGPLSAGPPGVHRTCPLLGLLGRRRVRAEKARERPVVGGPPRGAPHLPASWPSWPPASTGREGARTARCRRGPQGCTALARFLAFLAAGEYGPRRRENGPLSAGPPGVHRTCPLLGLLGRRRVRGEKARERPVVGGPPRGAPHLPASWLSWPPASTGREGARTARCRRGPQGCTALARFLAFLAAGEYRAKMQGNPPPPPPFLAFLGPVQESQVTHKSGARLKRGVVTKNGKDCPMTTCLLTVATAGTSAGRNGAIEGSPTRLDHPGCGPLHRTAWLGVRPGRTGLPRPSAPPTPPLPTRRRHGTGTRAMHRAAWPSRPPSRVSDNLVPLPLPGVHSIPRHAKGGPTRTSADVDGAHSSPGFP